LWGFVDKLGNRLIEPIYSGVGNSKKGYKMVGGRCCAVIDYSCCPQNVAIHEIGHGLGWYGHSATGTDVMSNGENFPTTLSDRDKNHLIQIYPYTE